MANTAYISAGLPVARNAGQSPAAGVNTIYLSAGLPAAVLAGEPPETIPRFLWMRFPAKAGSSVRAPIVPVGRW